MEKLQLEYLYPQTASRYDFYLIPKLLIDNEAFDDIDYGSKLLYSLMLNRASLSATNAQDYTDEDGKLYIIYTVEQVMEDIRCSNKTAVKIMKQLDDIGLIEKKRQGQGKPSIIYVKDFSSVHFLKCKKYTSRNVKSTLLEVENVHSNNNNNNKTDRSKNDHSQSHCQTGTKNSIDMNVQKNGYEKESPENVPPLQGLEHSELSLQKPCIDYTTYERKIKKNIEYDIILQDRKYDPEIVQELVNCMLDVICTRGETVRIGGEDKPRELVKSVYLQLRMDDIEHVIERYESVRHKIIHLHLYLKTMLYTIRQEHGHYYTNAVRADGVV